MMSGRTLTSLNCVPKVRHWVIIEFSGPIVNGNQSFTYIIYNQYADWKQAIENRERVTPRPFYVAQEVIPAEIETKTEIKISK